MNEGRFFKRSAKIRRGSLPAKPLGKEKEDPDRIFLL
jgi:hypothetical protein